jgi:predicted tellurium resistance membrane protein TerC
MIRKILSTLGYIILVIVGVSMGLTGLYLSHFSAFEFPTRTQKLEGYAVIFAGFMVVVLAVSLLATANRPSKKSKA